MNKLLIFAAMLGIGILKVHGQVAIQPVLPSAGIIQKTQLWNIIAVNSSGKQYSCRLNIVMRDRKTNLEIITANTALFTLLPGINQLNTNSVSPVQYNYLSTDIDTRPDGFIPAGSYMCCYLLTEGGEKASAIAEECFPVDIEPLSPPALIYPSDSMILNINPGQFSWTPPVPQMMFNNLEYEVLIVPVNDGQKGEDAIQQNLPVCTERNQKTNILNYSMSPPGFQKNKWYAWQVIARDGIRYAAKSETWVFKISDEKTGGIPGDSYVLLDNAPGSQDVFYVNDNTMKLKFHSYEKQYNGQIHLYGPGKKSMQKVKKTIMYGDNFLTIHLKNSFQAGETYTVELTSENGQKYSGHFVIK